MLARTCACFAGREIRPLRRCRKLAAGELASPFGRGGKTAGFDGEGSVAGNFIRAPILDAPDAARRGLRALDVAAGVCNVATIFVAGNLVVANLRQPTEGI